MADFNAFAEWIEYKEPESPWGSSRRVTRRRFADFKFLSDVCDTSGGLSHFGQNGRRNKLAIRPCYSRPVSPLRASGDFTNVGRDKGEE